MDAGDLPQAEPKGKSTARANAARSSQATGLYPDNTLESASTEGATHHFGESLRSKEQGQGMGSILIVCALLFSCTPPLFPHSQRNGRGRIGMKRSHDYRIITNNPLVARCLAPYYDIALYESDGYRDILVRVRDLVYAGHRLYTHPISGSVKPNETPYRSVVVSKAVYPMDMEQLQLAGGSLATFDKFTPRRRVITDAMREDFQLIDYTLLCGALDFDAAAGFSNIPGTNKK